MVWAAMGRRGTGPIHIIEGIVDRYVLVDIMKKVMLPYACHRMGRN
jgi:hypothetical protein